MYNQWKEAKIFRGELLYFKMGAKTKQDYMGFGGIYPFPVIDES